MKTASGLSKKLLDKQLELEAHKEKEAALQIDLEKVRHDIRIQGNVVEMLKKELRSAQEREWTPTKKWPADTEFYIHEGRNANITWTKLDEYNYGFSWRKKELRWKKERTAQLHYSEALQHDPSAVLVAMLTDGENEVVPHRPVHAV